MIQHRTKRAIYVVLLCVALFASAFSIYNQFAKDNDAAQLATQVTQACAENRALAKIQGLDCDKAEDVKSNTPTIIEGPKGQQGDRGFTGEQGDPGTDGRDGDNGTSGVDGQAGVNGAQGAVGATGDVGQTGSTGEPGSTGPEGPQGPQGEKGDTGDPGATGQPGDDAPQIRSFRFSGGLTDCELVITMSNETSYNVSAPGVFCVSE